MKGHQLSVMNEALQQLVEKINKRFEGKQLEISQKKGKITLEFVSDQFYTLEFDDYYELMLCLATLERFTRE